MGSRVRTRPVAGRVREICVAQRVRVSGPKGSSFVSGRHSGPRGQSRVLGGGATAQSLGQSSPGLGRNAGFLWCWDGVLRFHPQVGGAACCLEVLQSCLPPWLRWSRPSGPHRLPGIITGALAQAWPPAPPAVCFVAGSHAVDRGSDALVRTHPPQP